MPLCNGCGQNFSLASYTSHLRHTQKHPCVAIYKEALQDIPDSDAIDVDEFLEQNTNNSDLALNDEDVDEDGNIMFPVYEALLPGSQFYLSVRYLFLTNHNSG